MRIIHTDTDDLDNPLHGGQPIRTYEINKRLARHHNITILTSTYAGAKKRVVRNGINYRRLGIRVPGWGLSPHLSFLVLLGPQVKTLPHDIIIEEFTPPLGFCLLPLWTPKPVISMVQWFFFDQWEKRYKLPFFKLMSLIARKEIYRYFIVQTEAMGNTIKRLVPAAVIKKIPCGINRDCFLEAKTPGDFVLYLGRLERIQKGLDILLKAWKIVCSEEKILLIMAGEGKDRQYLEKVASNYGIHEQVKFVGMVDNVHKRELLRSCRFLVMASRSETFGIVALEAMAAQKPVVAFNIEHLNEVLHKDWSILIDPFDVQQYASAILSLWKNPEYCAFLGQKGQQKAKSYLWDNLAAEQEKFYLEVLEENVS